jgi:predicted MFS family arabinose efflux permease
LVVIVFIGANGLGAPEGADAFAGSGLAANAVTGKLATAAALALYVRNRRRDNRHARCGSTRDVSSLARSTVDM